ncbi:MAG: YjhG/YagF family D-xylonate dehydratase, partial [Chloroflexi bacterium]|nr:YjhG/YagF family D-xylonate dehydratase [Chloroflexota bacterium]
INLVGENGDYRGASWGDEELRRRAYSDKLRPHPQLPDDSRLWAALQNVSGGTWGGCVFDVEAIIETLEAGKRALGR